jgi:cob(I)alamin adenosyltransferase
MKVYTKTGDEGTTSLIGGERVSKCDARVEAYGTVDELSANLALLEDAMRAEGSLGAMVEWFEPVQCDLMVVEAMLAVGRGGEGKVAPLPVDAIERLERQIDGMSEGLPPVKGFVLPGGHPVVSLCHVCRTVCRRAERRVAAIPSVTGGCDVSPEAGQYLNRLSDWLYVIGRKIVGTLFVKERYWNPRKVL